jgi:queuine/archaeosine tRNA-ribosyltransferase
MASDLSRGRTKTTFLRVHGAELSAQAEHEAEKLNDAPVSAGLRSAIEAAIELSSDIGGAIDDLRVSPQDREQAHRNETKLRHWADEARTLAEKL